MSVSIYYNLTREQPLSDVERAAIDQAMSGFDLERYTDTGLGEMFTFYDSPTDGDVLAGSTKLPGDDEIVFEAALYWGALLGEVAAAIGEGEWDVRIDDIEMPMDPDTGAFTFPGA